MSIEAAVPAELRAARAPVITAEPVDTCPVCRQAEHSALATGFDYELLTCSNAWHFVRCLGCGHAYLNPRPSDACLKIIYPSNYYAYDYGQVVHPVALGAKQFLDGLKIKSILRAASRAPGSYLDVGCGDGRYLRALASRGLPRSRAYGLELDQRSVERLTSQGFPVYCERVEDCERIADGALDLITMFHVIEHISFPAAALAKLVRWLAPGGLLAIETPNLESIDAHWFRSGTWGGYHIPRHFHIFTPSSLQQLLTDSGLEVIDVRYQTGHSFWMYSLHHLLRYRERPWPKLAKLFNPFGGSLGLLALFTGVDKLRAALGYKTSAMLCLARKPVR